MELSANKSSGQEVDFRKEAARLRLVLEQTRDIVLVVDRNGRILDANRAADEAYGYSRNELIGMNVESLRAVPTPADVREKIKAAYDSGVLYETVQKHRDGTAFQVEVSSQRAVIEGEELIVSVVRNIANRKTVESELRLTQFSVDNAAESVFWIQEDGTVFYANKKASETLGYSQSELIGKPIFDIDASITRDQWAQHWKQVRLHGALTIESSQCTKSGHIFPVEVTANHVSFEGRELHCSFVRSLEYKKMLEEQLRQAQKMEAIGRLAGGVAHDFNNLLMIISGYAELLESDLRSVPLAQAKIDAIRAAVTRGGSLTRQLLAFSRKQVLQPSIISIGSTVQEVADMVGRVMGKDIEVMVITTSALGMVNVDRGQMEQVILNLVVNARDAMPHGGKLIIETSNVEIDEAYAKTRLGTEPGSYVMLSVSDNGCGMTENVTRRIFEPFFTTKAEGKGTGLGLSTVYGIVKQSGGSIEVYSEPDRGSTFKLYFPVASDSGHPEHPGNAPSLAELRGNNELVLVVEDEPTLREVVSNYLSESGYRVLSAANYAEALEAARENREELAALITDVVLPGQGGPEIAKAIKDELPGVKVAYMSGYTFDAVLGNLSDGADFIQKPFTRVILLGVVKKLLGGD